MKHLLIKKIAVVLGLVLIATIMIKKPFVFALDERPVSSYIGVDQDPINLTEGTTTDVVINALITDADGCADIASVEVKLFRTDLGYGCTPDDNNCYVAAATEVSGTCEAVDLDATWQVTIPVEYFADPTDVGTYSGTDWTAEVIASDSVGSGSSEGDYTLDIESLTAISVTSSIDFGSFNFSENTGSTDSTTTVTNTGNKTLGLYVRGSTASYIAMYCDSGAIPIGNVKYDSRSGVFYSGKERLRESDSSVEGFSLPQRTGGVSTDDIHWGLGMPSSGAGGACTGTVMFTPFIN